MPDLTRSRSNPKAVAVWLFVCAAMVFAMTVIGAITRLTESGLSITEWRPLIGAIPPLNEEEWNRVFELYKQTPEFQKENFWMHLRDFKPIFFWEWFHRLWGRLIGLVFVLPLAFFWMRRMIPRGMGPKLLALLALGGAQGFMGWYMVQSGLIDVPSVSHYRLAAHLAIALLILSLMLWFAFSLIRQPHHADRKIHIHTWVSLVFVCATIIWGAFTAGLDAGFIYNNDFPLVNGKLLPPDFWGNCAPHLNFISNLVAVQFIHRYLALASVIMISSLWLHGVFRKKAFLALHALAVMIFVQFGLGVFTLLTIVDIRLAVAHQAGAMIVLMLLVTCLYETKTPKRRAGDTSL